MLPHVQAHENEYLDRIEALLRCYDLVFHLWHCWGCMEYLTLGIQDDMQNLL